MINIEILLVISLFLCYTKYKESLIYWLFYVLKAGKKIMTGNIVVEHKTISISSKRQITIPLKFFNALGFKNEAECIIQNNGIVIRPVKDNAGGEFAEQILSDLIKQGYSGDELLKQFKTAQSKVRPAVEKMLEEATRVANVQGEYSTYSDIFDPKA